LTATGVDLALTEDVMMRHRGELYPCETDLRLCDELETGQEVEVDMNKDVLTVLATGKQYQLKPIGEVCHCCSPAFAPLQRLML